MFRLTNSALSCESALSVLKASISYPERLENAADLVADYVQEQLEDQVNCLKPQRPYIVAIDGRAGSGKTTLAACLQEKLKGSLLIHLDDFFLQPHQRTPERLVAPGKNVDYERIIEEILLPAQAGKVIRYRPFSCKTMTLMEQVDLGQPKILILEGSYSMNEELRAYMDTSIFLTCSKEVQLERILHRNGKEKLQDFIHRWIPLEEHYFQTFDPIALCDFVFDVSAAVI